VSNVRRIFSRAERSFILKHAVGKPTGTKVEIGGFEFDLIPLTPSQADGIFSLLDAFSQIETVANAETGDATFTQANFFKLIAKEGSKLIALAREILYTTAKANGLIGEDGGDDVFDEWFKTIDLFALVRQLVPALIAASGMKSLLGNRSTPSIEPSESAKSAGEQPAGA
jgi:hypothetical protein